MVTIRLTDAATSPVASPPDPAQDHPATTLPENINALLYITGILLGYGRHLIETICQRATAPNFGAIAANFGTAKVSTIIAHLNRGILRCMALERILRARAATGKDIDFVERQTSITLLPESEGPQPEQPEQQAAT